MNRSPRTFVLLFAALALVAPAVWAADSPDPARASAAAPFPPPELVQKQLHDPSGWTVHRRAARGGVEVFKKDIEGFRTPGFRGEKTVAVSSDLLFGLLVDFDNHVSMSTRVPLVISKILATEGNIVDFFQLVDTPAWTLAQDRCWFNQAHIKRDVNGEKGRHIQEWRNLEPSGFPDYWQEVLQSYPKAVVLPVNVGSWEVVPIGPNSSRLIYRVVTDPGGKIPANLQEFVTGRTLPDNLLQFEEVALQRASK